MATSLTKKQIQGFIRRLKKKYPGTEYEILYSSNGEVALLPKGKTILKSRRFTMPSMTK